MTEPIIIAAILAFTAITCIFKLANTYQKYLISQSTLAQWKEDAHALQERFEERIRQQEGKIDQLQGDMDAALMQLNVTIDG